MISDVPPGLFLIIAAALMPLVPPITRLILAIIAPLWALLTCWLLPLGGGLILTFFDFELRPIDVHAASRLFGTAFCLAALAAGIFAASRPHHGKMEITIATLYAGLGLGVVFAGDWLTLFLCLEGMAIAATLVIWSHRQGDSWGAGLRYAIMHLLGGVILMAGIAGILSDPETTTALSGLVLDRPSHWLVFWGLLVLAAAPPFSAWAADAYPAASPRGTIYLSCFTTKAAVFVLLTLFSGEDLLVWFGLYMAFYGVFYAMLEDDIRRLLVYGLVNQVGFLLVGIGIGTRLGINGAAAHAFVHIFYQALLFVVAAAVIEATGKHRLSELGGLSKHMRMVAACGVVGVMCAGALPGTGGFISKTILTAAAGKAELGWVWFLLTITSAGMFIAGPLRFIWFVFFGKDCGVYPAPTKMSTRITLTILVAICLVTGLAPAPFHALLPYPVTHPAYDGASILNQLQLLSFSICAFFLMRRYLVPTRTISLDLDYFYRRFSRSFAAEFADRTMEARGDLAADAKSTITSLLERISKHHGPEGALARSWPTGSTALWLAIMLGLYLVIFYLSR